MRFQRSVQEQGLKIPSKLFFSVLALATLFAGCKKEAGNQETANATKPAAPAPTATPAAAPSASADPNTETTAKLAGAAWALKQDEIKNDPKGQWAIQAKASSSYNDAAGHSRLVRQSGHGRSQRR